MARIFFASPNAHPALIAYNHFHTFGSPYLRLSNVRKGRDIPDATGEPITHSGIGYQESQRCPKRKGRLSSFKASGELEAQEPNEAQIILT